MVKNAAHVACAALNEVCQEHVRQRVPPNGTFEVCTMSICIGYEGLYDQHAMHGCTTVPP